MEPTMVPSDIDTIITRISTLADELPNGPGSLTALQQEKLFRASRKLSSRCTKVASQDQLASSIGVKVALDMGLFDFVCASGERNEFSIAEIASHTGADPVLVERIMRALVLSNMFTPTPANTYEATPAIHAFAPDSYVRDLSVVDHEIIHPLAQKLPAFLAQTGHQNPNSVSAGLFQLAIETKETFYTWLQQRPELLSQFSSVVQGLDTASARWPEVLPVAERFARFRGPNAEGSLRVVDIAGGRGTVLMHLLEKLPDLLDPEIILQDLPEVLADGNVSDSKYDPRIHKMAYNFFGEQPVCGAHVYALTRILHNWPDAECRQILRRVRDAMDTHSVLFVGDRVFPDGATELSAFDVMGDLVMMMLFGAMERTEMQFRALLVSVGLEVVRVWRAEGARERNETEGVLEVRRVD